MADSKKAIEDSGLTLLENYPKYSPDLNHIENAWHLLRQELLRLAPSAIERRTPFLRRLTRTVARMNKNGAFTELCRGQKDRAADVIALKGARTKW
jgi:transposase